MDINMNDSGTGKHGRSRSRTSIGSAGNTKSFRHLFSRFSEKTSMQGIFYIYSAKKSAQKIFWVCLLIACTIGMSSHLYYLMSQFLEYPVNTKIELGFSNLIFPAVTICNVNPIRSSKLYMATEELQKVAAQLQVSDFWGYESSTQKYTTHSSTTSGQSSTTSGDISTPSGNNSTTGPPVWQEDLDYDYSDYYIDEDDDIGSIVDLRLVMLEKFRGLYKEENRTTKEEMGHRIEDMLISCTLGKFKCFASNFTVVPHHVYGNCFTLITGDRKISKAGPSNGLSLVLYMDRLEYLNEISEGYGARVQIHDRDTYPYPDEGGIFVPTASETNIGIRMVTIERQDEPYGNCSEDTYKDVYGYKYTRYLCQTMCSHNKTFQKCGCHVPEATEIIRRPSDVIEVCTNHTELKCMHDERKRQQKRKEECECFNPCRENQFLKTISHRNWPSEKYLQTLKEGVCFNIKNKCYEASLYDTEDVQSRSLDYVKIDIFYEDLNYERIVETPEIENAQFMSDFGGAVGLWIGFSVLSFFELIQLLVECIKLAVTCRCFRN
ncbi:degenerin unc-8-like [Mytilus trossulus]|uniref:degenerin unc-8-like n=1 Tax=Mytilus trossulus TaxID=6551 RepID=UPI003003E993